MALRRHKLALEAIASDKFASEIVPVEVPQRRGEPIIVDTDEAPREGTTEEVLEKLNPAFDKDGTVTAGNAPGVNDGACAFVLMSDEQAAKEEIAPLATILSHEIGRASCRE